MKKIEINKIKKNRTYTYEEIKEMFEDAAAETCANPFGDIEKLDKKPSTGMEVSAMLLGIIITHTLGDNLFEDEEETNAK